MAEASLDLHETPDRFRFNRFVNLLIAGGTTIIRGLFDHIHPPSTLADLLQNQHLAKLNDLKRDRFINKSEWNKLFPSGTASGPSGESKDFDLTLLLKLLRKICNLTEPRWDTLPDISDHSLQVDLALIKFYRNCVYAHNIDANLPEDVFNYHWEELSDALLRILDIYDTPDSITNWKKEVRRLKTIPVPSQEIQMSLPGFPGIVIHCSYNIEDPEVVNQVKEEILVGQLRVALQSQGVEVEHISIGSVMIHLRVKDDQHLKDLWKRYKNGELKAELEKVLIADAIKKLYENVEIDVHISEEEYLDAKSFFEELNQMKLKKGHFAVEITKISVITESLKEDSLEIIHGNTITDRGTKFQAHFAQASYKDEVDKVIYHIKRDPMYARATNIVWAYKLYRSENKYAFDFDDSNGDEYLAGKRLQVLLENTKVKNIVVIATCWQGEEYLYLDIFKHITERVLDLFMSHRLIDSKTPEEIAEAVDKFEAYFEKRKRKIAHALFDEKQQADPEAQMTKFEFIQSEVIIDHNSNKFQAHLTHVTSLEQIFYALMQLEDQNKDVARAHDFMGAYRIYDKERKIYLEDSFDSHDKIRAGKDVLFLLQKHKVEDVIVVLVTHHHGEVAFINYRYNRHTKDCALEVIKMATEQGMLSTEGGDIEPALKTGKGK